MEDKIPLSNDEIIMGFVASCVEDVADTLCVDYSEVYHRMGGRRLLIFPKVAGPKCVISQFTSPYSEGYTAISTASSMLV